MDSRHLLVAGAALLAAAAGCGTSPSSGHGKAGTAHTAFLASANQICQRSVDADRGHNFPLKKFDPLHPEPSQLPTVGDYLAKYGGIPTTDSALQGLIPPSVDAARWHTLLHLADTATASVQRQIAAARARDVTSFVQTVREAQQLTAQFNAEGKPFGFTSRSPCAQVFG